MPDNETENDSLPPGWRCCALADVTRLSKEKWNPGEGEEQRYISLQHIEPDSGGISGWGSSDEVKSAKNVFEEGEVLYGKLRPYLNKVAQPTFDGVCSTDILVFKNSGAVDGGFLKHRLRSPDLVDYANHNSSGINLPRISPDVLGAFELGVPPLPEQRRIAERIDAIQSHSRKAREALERLPALLDEYRQGVLHAAFSGRLTADWRAEHPGAEPAEALLAGSRERRVNKYKKRGKLTEPDPRAMFELPASWSWVQIGDVASHIRYGTSDKSSYDNNGIPMLRMGDIFDGKLRYDDLKYMPADWEDRDKFMLEDGDLLFNRTNSAELVGKCAVYKADHPEAVFASYLVRAKLYGDVCRPDLLAYYINSTHGRKYIRFVTDQQVGQANVNATKMASMPIPLPPVAEQHEIVRRVQQRLERIDRLAEHVEAASTRIDGLDRAVLTKAFRGELVETEAARAAREGRGYETAAELLAQDEGQLAMEL